ncbi:MAG: isochorismate synthase [Deltaproteobacteria bacterium]|nr:isochorismate synthase [Deltaproteobacteria bacterium]MBW2361572.1 isochorismate synthase [Deltaproteobacteria bacterium]
MRRADELEARIAAALAGAAADGEPHFVAVDVAVGIDDPLAFAALQIEDRFYLERPNEGLRVLGLGCREAIEADGPERFARADARRRALLRRVHGARPDAPLLTGGFAFAAQPRPSTTWQGYPAARLVLPELLWFECDAERSVQTFASVQPGESAAQVAARCATLLAHWETLLRDRPTRAHAAHEATRFELAADRPGSDFCKAAERALRDIAAGELEKLVLARSVRIDTAGGFDVVRSLQNLRQAHPACAVFAVGRGDATFIGATPERLLRVCGTAAQTSAVAGSAPRGRDPQEDAELARALQESKKEQSEHAVVVRALRAAFEECCDEFSAPEAPQVLRLENVQHLETPLCGTLRHETTLLELAGRLHPTPAVGGSPYAAALAWLDAHERCDRGWYAGLVGYVDARGGGELCVALRSALLRGDTAHLLAGAGLVAGSEPEAELRETRLKLRTLLHALVEL